MVCRAFNHFHGFLLQPLPPPTTADPSLLGGAAGGPMAWHALPCRDGQPALPFARLAAPIRPLAPRSGKSRGGAARRAVPPQPPGRFRSRPARTWRPSHAPAPPARPPPAVPRHARPVGVRRCAGRRTAPRWLRQRRRELAQTRTCPPRAPRRSSFSLPRKSRVGRGPCERDPSPPCGRLPWSSRSRILDIRHGGGGGDRS